MGSGLVNWQMNEQQTRSVSERKREGMKESQERKCREGWGKQ